MKKQLNILFILLIFSVTFHAQKDSVYYGQKDPQKAKQEEKSKKPWLKEDFKDRFFFGGNFNAVFGIYTIVNLSPLVGFKVTDKLNVGAGFIFNYYAVKYGSQTVSATFYGSHTFARYFVLDNIFIQGQYDRLYQPKINFAKGTLEKGWVDYFLVGGGVRQPLGDRAYLVASLLYNVNYEPNQISAYYNPLVQIGIISNF